MNNFLHILIQISPSEVVDILLLEALSVIYCYATNYSKTYWLNANSVYYFSPSYGELEQFFSWPHLHSVTQLSSTSGQIMANWAQPEWLRQLSFSSLVVFLFFFPFLFIDIRDRKRERERERNKERERETWICCSTYLYIYSRWPFILKEALLISLAHGNLSVSKRLVWLHNLWGPLNVKV